MLKRLLIAILATTYILGCVGLAMALGDGNGRKGKYLYRKNCRTCHADGKGATDLSPISKTQAEWVTSFAPEAIAGYQCKEEFDKLSEKDMNDIYTYLHDHAKDSPEPATCK